MSGPPPFPNLPWRASSDFPTEHHTVPPPGVSSVAPPHPQSFGWSSPMALPASGSSPGTAVGTFPPHSLMKMNQVHACGNANPNLHPWPLLPSTNNPRVAVGVDLQHSFGNANVRVPNLAGYGIQNASFGIHTAGNETGRTVLGTQMYSYGGAQDTGHKSQDDSQGGQIMNYKSTSHSAVGYLQSANPSSTQNSSSVPHSIIDSNPPFVQPKEIDPKSLLIKIKEIVAQANDAAQKVANLVNIRLTSLPRKGLIFQTVADGAGLSAKTNNDFTHTNAEPEGAQRFDDFTTASTVFNNMVKCLKDNDSFYKCAPGVVQVPVFANDERGDSFSLPDFAKGERWGELTPHIASEGDVCPPNTEAQETLLPSRFWLFRNEVSLWKELPSRYSSTLLRVAAALIMVKQADLKRWLFTHANSYGVAYNKSLANHIVVLLVFCLRAVHREATTAAESGKEVRLLECRVMSCSAYWLASQLSLLYDPVASRNLVLDLFKFALESAAYCITFSGGGSSQDLEVEEPSKVKCVKADSSIQEQELPNHYCTLGPSCVGDGFLHLQQLAAAVLAIQSEGLLVKSHTCDFMTFQSPSSQRSAVHSMIVKRAEEVRASRADYQAVLEHDGLIWQRSQNQESKKNKTKEEILAEERDYKRRRMSYRGKKVQRTPSEILRDIIEGHMEEIVSAGGIGCFGRIPQDMLTKSESDISALGIKDGSDAARRARSSSKDMEGKEMGPSYSVSSRHSGSSRVDRRDGQRSISMSSSSGSRRNSSPYQMRYERSSHDHSEDKLYERKYETDRKDNRRERWEERERSAHHRSEKQYSSSRYSRDRSYSPS